MVNVFLLAFFLAVSILGLVSITTKPADARIHSVFHSVRQTNFSISDNEFKTRQVVWKNRTACCSDIVDAGVRSWDGLGRVDWVYSTNDPTLRFQGTSDPAASTKLGQWSKVLAGTDVIEFYVSNFRGLPQADRNWLGRHEMGHALSYTHPYNIKYSQTGYVINRSRLVSAANQRRCVMHTFHTRTDWSLTPHGITNLTSDDRYQHRIGWP